MVLDRTVKNVGYVRNCWLIGTFHREREVTMTFLTRNSNGARPKLMLHNELRSSPQRLRIKSNDFKELLTRQKKVLTACDVREATLISRASS
ncbi:hypothetical protein OUZ56_030540 [Daphnia magna]|uniref:Uncharacterized protein n=1 Tax=Daphnia magna TaxID=35525 RepID=A0ABQ9ZS61_9CRUS|nr:hypothetical protein OUZ56_030540 [Daphnia magna]